MAKKVNAFYQEQIPLPECNECVECGEQSGQMCLFYGGRWFCMPCFFEGPGKHWPRRGVERSENG